MKPAKACFRSNHARPHDSQQRPVRVSGSNLNWHLPAKGRYDVSAPQFTGTDPIFKFRVQTALYAFLQPDGHCQTRLHTNSKGNVRLYEQAKASPPEDEK